MAKKKYLDISTNLKLPTDVITERVAIMAKSGSGKSYTAMKICEQMLAIKAQVVVVDTVGNWYGLRLGANGKPDGGMDVMIFGGRHGDIPLEHTAGDLIAKAIVDGGLSVILDVSMMSKSKQGQFVTQFATSLLEYRKRWPSAMHVFWEEAYRVFPQKQTKGSKGEMLEATEEIVTMGRNFGIGHTIICQRAAQVSKTVLTQAGIFIALNTNYPSDKKVIREWIDAKDVGEDCASALDNLNKLKKGEALVFWPEEFGLKRVKISKKETFDASKTPKFGEKAKRQRLLPINLSDLEVMMAETIERAKKEDPKALQEQVKALQRDNEWLKKQKTILDEELDSASGKADLIAQTPAISEKELVALRGMVEALSPSLDRISKAIERVSSGPAAPIFKSNSIRPVPGRPRRVSELAPGRPRRVSDPAPGRPRRVSEPLPDKLPRGAVGMLKALGAIYPGGLTKKQIALGAGMKSTGGTFGTYMSKLNVTNMIEVSGSMWTITPDGLEFLGDDIPIVPDSPEDKLEFWCKKIPGKAELMLRLLFQCPDTPYTKDEIADYTGLEVRGGTFGTYLSKLTANGLVDKVSGGYQISPEMF